MEPESVSDRLTVTKNLCLAERAASRILQPSQPRKIMKYLTLAFLALLSSNCVPTDGTSPKLPFTVKVIDDRGSATYSSKSGLAVELTDEEGKYLYTPENGLIIEVDRRSGK